MNAGNDRQRMIATIAQTLVHADRSGGAVTPKLIADKVAQAALMLPTADGGESDLEAAITELVRRFSHWIGRDSVMDDSTGHVAWLFADRKQGWRYWPRYQALLEQRLSVDVVSALDASTDGILGRLEDPRREGAWDRRGLVVGHVQSGKTGNYAGLVCKAADAGYKIIIVLAGLHNNLRAQTQIRMEESFLGYETSPNRDPGRPIGVGVIDSDPAIHPHCATTRMESGDFNAAVARHFAISPEERPWLFVVKKQKTVLTQLLRWIAGHVADSSETGTGRRIVTKLPLLVIDDESDHASVDTGEQVFNADGTPDEEHEPRTINRLIRTILHTFSKSAYVGYTATPFANIFIHRRGVTRDEGPDLFPQAFIINLAAPSNYVGPSRIFGVKTSDGRVGGMGIDRPITDHLDKEKQGDWMPAKHKKDHVPLYKGKAVVPPSLRQAIQAFLLACAARVCRGQGAEHSSMLVHVTRFTDVQRLVHDAVADAVGRMRQRLTTGIDASGLLNELEDLWERDFVPKCREIAVLVPESPPLLVPSWTQILSVLPSVAADVKTQVVNGTAKDVLDYAENSAQGLKVISIGGEKLSRGLTLEGLCTSYFVRTTKMYDTLMQMGRWFGYRPGYMDLCRLYTSDDLVEWFGHIADASEELRDEFDEMAQRGDTPETYGLRVLSHPVLLVTSPLKMRSARTLQISFSGSLVETVSLFSDRVILDRNLAGTERLLEKIGKPAETDPVRKRGAKSDRWTGYVWNGVDASHVADFLEEYTTHPSARKVNSSLLGEFVRSMAKEGELTSWTIALIGGGQGSQFELGKSGIRIDMLKRKEERTSSEAYSIGRLLSPRDEAIDLDEDAWLAALELTRKNWRPDPAKMKLGQAPTPPDLPNGPAIRTIRGEGADGVAAAKERGLLLLYGLDPQLSENRSLQEYTRPVITFGASFPRSKSHTKVEYTVDHLVWEQEYGPAG